MEKVLLAIDGISPNKKAFQYALELCRRIQAELTILQIIRPQNYRRYLKAAADRTRRAKKKLDSTWMAAAFAEAGEPEMAEQIRRQALADLNRLLPESKVARINCEISLSSGNPEKEIVRYVNRHREVVLTVLDDAGNDRRASFSNSRAKQNARAANLMDGLATPLVMIRGSAL
jgi:nucleotide-binding universal stress UspA family protein